MKILLYLIFILTLTAACTGGNRSDDSPSATDTIATDTAIISCIDSPAVITDSLKCTVTDSTAGHWKIKTEIAPNDRKIENWDEETDSSVFITLFYDGKQIMSGKEIRTSDLITDNRFGLGSSGMKRSGSVLATTDSAIYLRMYCGIPYSDVIYDLLYQVTASGDIRIIQTEWELGNDVYHIASEFIELYFNDRATGLSAAQMSPMFRRYCSEQIADMLASGKARLFAAGREKEIPVSNISCYEDLSDDSLRSYTFGIRFHHLIGEPAADSLFIEINRDNAKIIDISPDSSGLRSLPRGPRPDSLYF